MIVKNDLFVALLGLALFAYSTATCQDLMMRSIEPQAIDDETAKLIRPNATATSIGLDDLPNETVLVTTYTIDKEGKLSYLVSNVAGKGSTVVVTQDYMKFRSVKINNVFYRIGIGLRIKAQLVVTGKNVNLSGLFAIGVAASQNQVKGTLSVEVIGISGRDVTNAMPLPAQLSPESLSSAIQAAASIKARIYDSYQSNISTESNSKNVGNTGNLSQNIARVVITLQLIAKELASDVKSKAINITL